jgi:hypothetical protein
LIEKSLNTLTRGYRRKKGLSKTLNKKKNLFYFDAFRQCNVVIPKVEICTFPWYCLYRDIFIFSPSRRKERSIESLEAVSSLLIPHPRKEDRSFDLYRRLHNAGSQYLPESVISIEKLGIRYQIRWLFREPTRTGGELILNRLQIFNYKDWCVQASRRLKVLKRDIEIVGKLTSSDKNKRLKTRRLLRIRNQILIRFRFIT